MNTPRSTWNKVTLILNVCKVEELTVHSERLSHILATRLLIKMFDTDAEN